MKEKPYKRRAGDLEIRILPDGRLVMIAPDEALMQVAQTIESPAQCIEESEKSADDRAAKTDPPPK